jgi:hypothetical protein
MRGFLEEHYPHLLAGLTENWSRPEAFKAFMASLIFDSRGGRTGWPQEAWEEISFLDALNKLVHRPDHEEEKEEPIHDDIKWVS